MKTTLEIPDELYRAVKAKAALEGRKVSEVVAEALRYVVESPAPTAVAADHLKAKRPLRKVEFPLIKGTSGRMLTMEALKQIMAEMDEEEDLKHAQLMRR